MRLYAPAKLNLFLHVTGRREDGYHELQTLFQLIDYADCLTIEPREDDRFEYADDADGDFGESNLCLRAAELARKRHPEGCGASIFLNKEIAVGAGLGGGSSDAAAVLHGLNRLWGQPWSTEELAAMGLELGADVPLFVYGRTAWAEGGGREAHAGGPSGGFCTGFADPVGGEYGRGVPVPRIDTMERPHQNGRAGRALGEQRVRGIAPIAAAGGGDTLGLVAPQSACGDDGFRRLGLRVVRGSRRGRVRAGALSAGMEWTGRCGSRALAPAGAGGDVKDVGPSPSQVKARGFDPRIRRFESCRPSHFPNSWTGT